MTTRQQLLVLFSLIVGGVGVVLFLDESDVKLDSEHIIAGSMTALGLFGMSWGLKKAIRSEIAAKRSLKEADAEFFSSLTPEPTTSGVLSYEATPSELPCPKCQQMTDSLKCLSYLHFMLFIGIFWSGQSAVAVACPSCMRRLVLRRTCWNLISANVLWPVVLVSHAITICTTFVRGHTRGIGAILLSQAQKQAQRNQSVIGGLTTATIRQP